MTRRSYKNPSHYRLDFIKENTFNRIWSVRMTRARVIVATAVCVAAITSLLWLLIAYTPLRTLMPDYLTGDIRSQYLETAMRLDSLEQVARVNNAYISNIRAIMDDKLPEDSAMQLAVETVVAADSLLAASDAERQFVQNYREEERFNLSVLAPLAAEGMIFTTPLSTSATVEPSGDTSESLLIRGGRTMPVCAVYRGTVVSVTAHDGRYDVVIQHPNDFVSTFSGLGEVFASAGQRVLGGQAVGQTAADGMFSFALWHNGTPLDPREYIAL